MNNEIKVVGAIHLGNKNVQDAVVVAQGNTVTLSNPNMHQDQKTFVVDKCFDEESCNGKALFSYVGRALLSQTTHGIHACILGYGAPKASRSQTLLGTAADPGLLLLVTQELFGWLAQAPRNCTRSLEVACFEVSGDTGHCLIEPTSQPIRCAQRHPQAGLQLAAFVYKKPRSQAALQQIVESAMLHVQPGWHPGVIVKLSQATFIPESGDVYDSMASLRFMDLQRPQADSSAAALQQHVDGVLGQGHSLSSDSCKDNFLVQLLEDAFSGACFTTVVAYVDSSAAHFATSMQTLLFIDKVRAVSNSLTPNHSSRAQMISELTAEVLGLRRQLASTSPKKCKKQRPKSVPRDVEINKSCPFLWVMAPSPLSAATDVLAYYIPLGTTCFDCTTFSASQKCALRRQSRRARGPVSNHAIPLIDDDDSMSISGSSDSELSNDDNCKAVNHKDAGQMHSDSDHVIQLTNAGVEGQLFTIRRSEGLISVRPNSNVAVTMNGVAVSEASVLRHGSVICVGHYKMKLITQPLSIEDADELMGALDAEGIYPSLLQQKIEMLEQFSNRLVTKVQLLENERRQDQGQSGLDQKTIDDYEARLKAAAALQQATQEKVEEVLQDLSQKDVELYHLGTQLKHLGLVPDRPPLMVKQVASLEARNKDLEAQVEALQQSAAAQRHCTDQLKALIDLLHSQPQGEEAQAQGQGQTTLLEQLNTVLGLLQEDKTEHMRMKMQVNDLERELQCEKQVHQKALLEMTFLRKEKNNLMSSLSADNAVEKQAIGALKHENAQVLKRLNIQIEQFELLRRENQQLKDANLEGQLKMFRTKNACEAAEQKLQESQAKLKEVLGRDQRLKEAHARLKAELAEARDAIPQQGPPARPSTPNLATRAAVRQSRCHTPTGSGTPKSSTTPSGSRDRSSSKSRTSRPVRGIPHDIEPSPRRPLSPGASSPSDASQSPSSHPVRRLHLQLSASQLLEPSDSLSYSYDEVLVSPDRLQFPDHIGKETPSLERRSPPHAAQNGRSTAEPICLISADNATCKATPGSPSSRRGASPSTIRRTATASSISSSQSHSSSGSFSGRTPSPRLMKRTPQLTPRNALGEIPSYMRATASSPSIRARSTSPATRGSPTAVRAAILRGAGAAGATSSLRDNALMPAQQQLPDPPFFAI